MLRTWWTQVVAFVLEAFFAEMDLETSQSCEEQDKVIAAHYDLDPIQFIG